MTTTTTITTLDEAISVAKEEQRHMTFKTEPEGGHSIDVSVVYEGQETVYVESVQADGAVCFFSEGHDNCGPLDFDEAHYRGLSSKSLENLVNEAYGENDEEITKLSISEEWPGCAYWTFYFEKQEGFIYRTVEKMLLDEIEGKFIPEWERSCADEITDKAWHDAEGDAAKHFAWRREAARAALDAVRNYEDPEDALYDRYCA